MKRRYQHRGIADLRQRITDPAVIRRQARWRRATTVLATLALGLALAGCASPGELRVGMTRAEVLQKVGRPSFEYAVPPGPVAAAGVSTTGEPVVHSGAASAAGPAGTAPALTRLEYVGGWAQEAWLVDCDDEGRVRTVTDARSQASFSQVRVGIDDNDAVRRVLGTPFRTERYAWSHLTAWHYPYRDGPWNLEMSAMFDDTGILRRLESGPDPRFDRGADRKD